MSKKRELWLTPAPATVGQVRVVFSFKLSNHDIGKTDAVKIEDDMTVSYICSNSFFNGLIMGDKIIRVNNVSGSASRCQSELLRGTACNVEVSRRKGVTPVTCERLAKSGCNLRKGHACFVLDVERPPHMTTTSVGLKLGIIKRRAFVTKVDPNTIASSFFGCGDSIMDMSGAPIPMTDNPDNFIREHLSRLSTGAKVSFLVERPISVAMAKQYQKFIESITYDDSEVEMAQDVIEIGREASNMHFMILKKLVTPSILSSDVRRRKKSNNKTSESTEGSITISSASTEMKITSDVTDFDDLKPVESKSHAAGSSSSDSGGAFDDE
ncbi:PDZ domain-containing protein [Caenorhabditis elegans]|uniref:PDZ domain-containing protein n=1 Tax=Caenorhabditis elegans TaxID=6239 RepID=Q19883_CAEEL|nr:PDZ domain-containing protein [Caenorhabditis elegans]CCD69725.1 PDZ domain-containing protein [Caenorhabditis elegans]|eukprot:NP_500590.2 Uncharacterized protein CELE_F28E10.4 [Caenorhabditis elegans]